MNNTLETASTSASTAATARHPGLPVVVVGAGPAGLAAAAQAQARGIATVVLEAGGSAGSAVLEWGHVRLFSPWSELIDPVAEKLLTEAGWTSPEPTAYPTGREWVEQYLAPLADRLAATPEVEIRYDHRVVGVARAGRDRLVAIGRDEVPFSVHVAGARGPHRADRRRRHRRLRHVGLRPNPLGGDGYPAIGEPEHADRIFYGIPDLTRPEVAERYAGKHVAVAGRGASAQNALVALTRSPSATRAPGSRGWSAATTPTEAFGGGDNDQLEQRGALGSSARRAVADGPVTTVTGFRTARVDGAPGTATDAGLGRRPAGRRRRRGRRRHRLPPRPLLAVGGAPRPRRRALGARSRSRPEIHPAYHSCGSVSPHGANLLRQPEGDLYLVGMKSYGRAPSFLTLTGYEQTRSVVAEIAGDHEAAARVELVLPDTGVCGGSGLFDESADGGCCAPAAAEPQLLTIGAAATGQATPVSSTGSGCS